MASGTNMENAEYLLSKTSFIKFEQCAKAFYLYKKHPYLRDKLSVDKQLTFKRGHDVGYFAQQLFPGGTDVSQKTKNFKQAAALTRELIESGAEVIYEATFIYNGALVMADILQNNQGVYTAYEVKSSLKISEVYIRDACLQYYVIKNCLPALEDLFLVTLNGEYVLNGEPEPKKMFKRRSMKERAEKNFTYFDSQLNRAREVIEVNAVPNIGIGPQCYKPYQCDFYGTCWKDVITPDSLFNIPLVDRSKLFEFYEAGARKIEDVQDDMLGKPLLVSIKQALQKNETAINADTIKRFIASLSPPVVAMDMEIWNPAIPQIEGTGPFEQIPFLASFYDGATFENTFVPHDNDQRLKFTQELLSISARAGTLLVYDKTMEVAVINKLKDLFPDYSVQLDELKSKLRDVFDIFLSASYYDPALKNNFSLKGVSNTLLGCGSLSEIGSGLEAMNVFDRYRVESNGETKSELKRKLIDYCNYDCLYTFELTEFLRKKVDS